MRKEVDQAVCSTRKERQILRDEGNRERRGGAHVCATSLKSSIRRSSSSSQRSSRAIFAAFKASLCSQGKLESALTLSQIVRASEKGASRSKNSPVLSVHRQGKKTVLHLSSQPLDSTLRGPFLPAQELLGELVHRDGLSVSATDESQKGVSFVRSIKISSPPS